MAYTTIKKIYKTENDEQVEEIANFIKSTIQKETSSVSARDAFCSNPNYTKASWVNIAHIVFHELTGINVIQLQSNVLLKKVTAGSSTFTPRLGSIIISAFNMFGAMASFPIVAKFGRKPILIVVNIFLPFIFPKKKQISAFWHTFYLFYRDLVLPK